MTFRYFDLGAGVVRGHMVAVWQPMRGGRILAYDVGGTLELETTSNALDDVINALTKERAFLIVSAHYL